MAKTKGLEAYKTALQKTLSAYFDKGAIQMKEDAAGNIEACVSVENGKLGYSGAFVVWIRENVVAVNLFLDGSVSPSEETLALVNDYNVAALYTRMVIRKTETGNALSLRYYVNGAQPSSVCKIVDAFMSEASNGEKTAEPLCAVVAKIQY